jgi:hypothetical protein
MTDKKIISFSLYNSRPKDVLNAVINCILSPAIYPDWICRFYVDDTIPKGIHQALESFKHVEVVTMPRHKGSEAMFWRFLPACDPTVAVMISRDADSWLSTREKACVDMWLESSCKFHIIRDHCYHSQKIMGGVWGAKRGAVPQMKEWIDEYVKTGTYDQGFLAEKVYPVVIRDTMIHKGQQHNNKHEFLPNGYFDEKFSHHMNIPEYNNIDEMVPGLSFREANTENKFNCCHCNKIHEVFIGGITENIPERAKTVLRDFYMVLNNPFRDVPGLS